MTQPEPQVPPSLDAIHVAEPCTQGWDAMTGDDRSRFCGSCRLHVYDLSSMTRAQAEELVMSRKRAGEHLCVRFFRRADGTVVTDDCGPIRRAIRRRTLRVRAAVVAAFAMMFPATGCSQRTMGFVSGGSADHEEFIPNDPPPAKSSETCSPAPPAPPTPAATPAAAPAAPAPPPPAPPQTEWTGRI